MSANENKKTLQEQTLEYLETHGIRKDFFAKQIGISPALLSNWFAGRASYGESRLNKISNIISDKQ